MIFLIGEFSKLVGLSIDTIRYYEKLGLIDSSRNEYNRRIYSEKELKWVEFVIKLKDAKMSLSEIQRYSELRKNGDSTMKERYDMLEIQKRKLKRDIEEIENTINLLDDKMALYNKRISQFGKGITS